MGMIQLNINLTQLVIKIKVLPISIKHSTRAHLSICEAINTASGTLDLLT